MTCTRQYLHFPNDLACVIHNADAGLLDRYVQSSKIVHAALLLLMLEAVNADLVFTISLKRSTQNLQLSTGRRPITPSFGGRADIGISERHVCFRPQADVNRIEIPQRGKP